MALRIYLIICTLFTILTSVYSQKRVDGPTITFDSKSERFTHPVGWAYNNSNKWISNDYYIAGDKDDIPKYRALRPNLSWIEWRTFKYQDKKYFVLLYGNVIGWFKYQYIREGLEIYPQTEFAVFSQEAYDDFLSNLKLKSGKTYYLKSAIRGYVPGFFNGKSNSKKEQEIISAILLKMGDTYHPMEILPYNSQLVDKIDVVRLLLFRSESSNDNEDPLKDTYFEMPYSEFEKAVILSGITNVK